MRRSAVGTDAGSVDGSVVGDNRIPPSDATTNASPAANGCRRDSECTDSNVCLGGLCQRDPCSMSNAPRSGDGYVCRALCVPLRPLCEGVVCGASQTCFDGLCVDGCFATLSCRSACGPNSFCSNLFGGSNILGGLCLSILPCDGICGAGFACTYSLAAAPRANPCDTIRCDSGQRCVNGACVVDACHSVRCAAGSYCAEGRCVDTCDCHGVDCGARGRCVLGQCVCTTDCANRRCGDPNGCGGECWGACAEGQTCGLSGQRLPSGHPNLECVCEPQCDADSVACGASDGCGGRCRGACEDGSVCSSGQGGYSCRCNAACPSATFLTACGTSTSVASRCNPGTSFVCRGTSCPSGHYCDGSACRCHCPSPETVACGQAIPGCGGTCGTGTRAPSGARCENGVLCTPATCPVNLVCGASMPDGCGGSCRGSVCPTGQVCTGATCVCAPNCFGANCGDSDGCGHTCPGGCNSGEFCTPSIQGYSCSGTAPQCAPPTTPCSGACCQPGDICMSGRCAAIPIQ